MYQRHEVQQSVAAADGDAKNTHRNRNASADLGPSMERLFVRYAAGSSCTTPGPPGASFLHCHRGESGQPRESVATRGRTHGSLEAERRRASRVDFVARSHEGGRCRRRLSVLVGRLVHGTIEASQFMVVARRMNTPCLVILSGVVVPCHYHAIWDACM